MKKVTAFAVLGVASIALAACSGSDDASSDLDVETVEMPANEPLEAIDEEPVADDAADLDNVAEPAPVDEQTAQDAADAAEDLAAAVEAAEAAAAEADAAAQAAESALDNLDVE